VLRLVEVSRCGKPSHAQRHWICFIRRFTVTTILRDQLLTGGGMHSSELQLFLRLVQLCLLTPTHQVYSEKTGRWDGRHNMRPFKWMSFSSTRRRRFRSLFFFQPLPHWPFNSCRRIYIYVAASNVYNIEYVRLSL